MITIPQVIEHAAPLWSGRIREESLIQLREVEEIEGRFLDLTDGDTCIMGEIWNFTRIYIEKCATCNMMGNSFYWATHSEETLQKHLNLTAEHIAYDHPELNE